MYEGKAGTLYVQGRDFSYKRSFIKLLFLSRIFSKICGKLQNRNKQSVFVEVWGIDKPQHKHKTFPGSLMDPTNARLFLYFHGDSLVAAHCTLEKGCHSSWKASPMDCFLLSPANYRSGRRNAQQQLVNVFPCSQWSQDHSDWSVCLGIQKICTHMFSV